LVAQRIPKQLGAGPLVLVRRISFARLTFVRLKAAPGGDRLADSKLMDRSRFARGKLSTTSPHLNSVATVCLGWDRYTKIGNTMNMRNAAKGIFGNVDLFTLYVLARFRMHPAQNRMRDVWIWPAGGSG
jgi:hypothetical protein